MITLEVRGLPREMTESMLTDLFTRHGRVHKLRIAKDLFSGQCKGFAELAMEGHEARAAITALNGSTQSGSTMHVVVQGTGPRRGRR
jgi:RNA recognition motif-containing protein